ncbi:hypothetical protein KFZ56_02050 [Virgibacillus sp. NKC19-3]|uniref:transposase n=1 Tax=Virgibacillus saliphilus TaxID=2831674 RepID=UPI001C9B3814|nr:transposase [Virgibacillus sp. NKC19-3]MBY7141887.1 hypothetical protein [Virgibacillus sp. NKC19-3]
MPPGYQFSLASSGYAAPDHATISRFKQKYLTDTVMEQLFFQQVVWLYEQKAITRETFYIDGTKIEAYANRYSFVWKKAITKHEAKMYAKWQALLEQINTTYCQLFTSPYEDYHLKKFRTRGTNNVKNELLILAFGYNLNKIHTKIQADRLNLYYHPLKTA